MSKLELIQGSCVNQNVDAVVNAANSGLRAGGGVCGAIFAARVVMSFGLNARKLKDLSMTAALQLHLLAR